MLCVRGKTRSEGIPSIPPSLSIRVEETVISVFLGSNSLHIKISEPGAVIIFVCFITVNFFTIFLFFSFCFLLFFIVFIVACLSSVV